MKIRVLSLAVGVGALASALRGGDCNLAISDNSDKVQVYKCCDDKTPVTFKVTATCCDDPPSPLEFTKIVYADGADAVFPTSVIAHVSVKCGHGTEASTTCQVDLVPAATCDMSSSPGDLTDGTTEADTPLPQEFTISYEMLYEKKEDRKLKSSKSASPAMAIPKMSPSWRMSLGRDGSGSASGMLELSAAALVSAGEVSSRAVLLRRGATSGLDVVPGRDGGWRQIMAKECFVQSEGGAPGEALSISFYEPSSVEGDLDESGSYVLKRQAVPFVTYDVGPVQTNGARRTIPLVERRGGAVVANNGLFCESRADGTVTLALTEASGACCRGYETVSGGSGGSRQRRFVRSGSYESTEDREYVVVNGRKVLAKSIRTCAGVELVTTYEHDSKGNKVAEVSPTGLRTEYDYDDAGRQVTRREFLPGEGAPFRTVECEFSPIGVRPHVPGDASSVDINDDDGTEEFDLPRVETEYAYGEVVSKTLRFAAIDSMRHRIVEEVRLADPLSENLADEWDSGSNVRSYTDYMPYSDCKPCSELPSLVMHEDGRIDRYAYSAGEYEPGSNGAAGVFTDSGVGEGDWFRTVVTHYAAGDAEIPNVTTRDVKIEIRSSKKILLQEQYVCTAPGAYARISWTATTRDALGQETLVVKSDGTRIEKTYAGRRLASMTDAEGLTTTYTYDALGRVISETKSGGGFHPDTTTTTTYDPEDRVLSRTVTAGDLSETETYAYDALGRTVATTDAAGIETRYLYAIDSTLGLETRSTIRAVGTAQAVTNTTISYADGRTKETRLNGIVKTAYEYGPNWTKTYEGPAGVASPRWSCSYEDAIGRTICETRPGFNGSLLVISNEYNTANQLVATRSYALNENSTPTPLTSTYFCYNSLGERTLTVEDMNLNSQIDWNDTDRIVSNDTRYVSLNGSWWRESSTWQTRQNGSPALTRVGLTRTRLTVLGKNGEAAPSPLVQNESVLISETHSLDPLGNETVSCTTLDRSSHTTTQTTLSPDSTLPAETVVQSGLTVSSRSPTGVTTTYAYDALGRQTAQTDGRSNTSQIVYDAQGRVAKTIDALGNETTYTYDALGRQTSVTDPLGHTVTTTYDAEGRIISQRGATYPVDYAYDAYGNKVSMTTYRNEDLANGDTTRWLYDEPSGCMTNKVYADGKGPSYSYTPDGKLVRRTWARGVATDYTYDDAGNLTRTEYDDNGVTPTITMSYDRVGNLVNATTAGVVTNLYAYNLVGNCTNEWQNDFQLTRFYDALGRSTGYAINGTRQTTIAYDSFGRIATMCMAEGRIGVLTASNENEFVWSYLPNTDLKASLLYPNGLTASWTYDANNQLLRVRNATPTNVISQFDYTYDAAGRRTAIAKSGSAFGDLSGSVDAFTYNTCSELISARRTKNGQPIPGFSEDFDYDPIGNRRSSATYNEKGGAQTSTYAANNLNQYISRTTPGYAAVRGEADPNAFVSVNGNEAYRLGAYYFGSDLFDNSAASGLANLETYAVLREEKVGGSGEEENDLVSATTNQVYLAQSPETSAYDDDGNQTLITTKTGLWRVTYNGENRPVLWLRDSDNMTLAMAYDHMGRRRQKNDQRFFYDGYLQVADNIGNAYAWDVTEPIATRPLVWTKSDISSYYDFDGNKNVSEVIAADGTLAAHYEYAPFGAVTVSRGTSAAANPWRFSSEFADDELGCDYYNYRHYEPAMGRWVQRDQIDVFNLYVWCDNMPCNPSGVDILGLTNEPGGFGWDNYSVEQRRCCNGTPYFPSASCCRNGKIFQQHEVYTGVSYFCMHTRLWYQTIIRIRLFSTRQLALTHCWLNVDGNRFGAYPNGGLFKKSRDDGQSIQDDSHHADDENAWYTSRTDVYLSPCRYDVEAFKDCMHAKRNASWTWTAWNNCGDFVEAAVSDCMRKASYDK